MATRAAAASSWVLSGLLAHSRASAPPALRVRIRLAVSVVTCRQAAMRRPASGFSRSNRSRIRRRTGISCSAHSTLRWPASARLKSLMSCSTVTFLLLHGFLIQQPIQLGCVAKGAAIARHELVERVAMVLRAKLLQHVGGGQGG